MSYLRRRNLQGTCDAHEAMREDGELNGVELSAEDALLVRAYSHAHVAPLCEAGLTAWFHQDGAGAGNIESFDSMVTRHQFCSADCNLSRRSLNQRLHLHQPSGERVFNMQHVFKPFP